MTYYEQRGATTAKNLWGCLWCQSGGTVCIELYSLSNVQLNHSFLFNFFCIALCIFFTILSSHHMDIHWLWGRGAMTLYSHDSFKLPFVKDCILPYLSRFRFYLKGKANPKFLVLLVKFISFLLKPCGQWRRAVTVGVFVRVLYAERISRQLILLTYQGHL